MTALIYLTKQEMIKSEMKIKLDTECIIVPLQFSLSEQQ